MFFRALSLALITATSLFATTLHQEVPAMKGSRSYTWEEFSETPFDQLVVSWNGKKPLIGAWDISVQLFQDGAWNEPIAYMQWGAHSQGSADLKAQDTIDIDKEHVATGFRVIVKAVEGANLQDLYCLHAYARDPAMPSHEYQADLPCKLEVRPVSQMAPQSSISPRICSPTSTLAVVRYLSGENFSDPVAFAAAVYDAPCDIYGNWVLNVAGASDKLGNSFRCYVERKVSFQCLLDQLKKGMPSVVSIKGPIEGSALPYLGGHLLVVTGFDPLTKRVFVMDPAFPTDGQCSTSYAVADFLEAWARRGHTAYLFDKNIKE